MKAIMFLALFQLSEQEKAWDAQQQARRDLQKRVERRDQAVAAGGPGADVLVRRHGDLAVEALLRVARDHGKARVADEVQALLRNSKPVERQGGVKALVAYREKLEQLPDPKAALQLIAREGCLDWMIEHHEQLRDASVWEAFKKEPSEYVWDFKEMPAPVVAVAPVPAEVPVVRAALGWWPWPVGGAAVALVVLVLVKRGRTAQKGEGR